MRDDSLDLVHVINAIDSLDGAPLVIKLLEVRSIAIARIGKIQAAPGVDGDIVGGINEFSLVAVGRLELPTYGL